MIKLLFGVFEKRRFPSNVKRLRHPADYGHTVLPTLRDSEWPKKMS